MVCFRHKMFRGRPQYTNKSCSHDSLRFGNSLWNAHHTILMLSMRVLGGKGSNFGFANGAFCWNSIYLFVSKLRFEGRSPNYCVCVWGFCLCFMPMRYSSNAMVNSWLQKSKPTGCMFNLPIEKNKFVLEF